MRSLASTLRAGLAGLLLAWATMGVCLAADVYVATLRAPAGSAQSGGHLYRVDLASGKPTFIGRVLVDGTQPVGLTAMAFHPRTNVLYAVTWGINDAKRPALLTVDPATGEARLVARLTRPLTDVSFDPEGRLYGWTADTGQLALVDIRTAKVSTIGDMARPATGGAFAIDSRGNGYVATWDGSATLDRVDLREGTIATGSALHDLREVSALRSMAFAAGGELLATHSLRSGHAGSVLLRIDPANGEAKAIGDIPEDSEAIAVAATNSAARTDLMRWIAYGVIASVLLVLALQCRPGPLRFRR